MSCPFGVDAIASLVLHARQARREPTHETNVPMQVDAHGICNEVEPRPCKWASVEKKAKGVGQRWVDRVGVGRWGSGQTLLLPVMVLKQPGGWAAGKEQWGWCWQYLGWVRRGGEGRMNISKSCCSTRFVTYLAGLPLPGSPLIYSDTLHSTRIVP
ncbi:hypothetical protein BDZ97DRAFT_1766167 [Flammula alnicola]|nr:hypothetical protein BDZ97DRAFT_1766167 [Flammula alnicola]